MGRRRHGPVNRWVGTKGRGQSRKIVPEMVIVLHDLRQRHLLSFKTIVIFSLLETIKIQKRRWKPVSFMSPQLMPVG